MRLVRTLWIGLLALLCLAGCAPSAQSDVAVHVVQAQWLSVPGTGLTLPPIQVSATDLPHTGWTTVPLPHSADRDTLRPLPDTATVTDWYQLALTGLTATDQPRYLYLPRWKTVGQIAVYGDGKLLYQSDASSLHNGYLHPLLLPLNGASGELSPSVVLLRMDRLRSSTSALSTVWVGAAQALQWRYQIRQMLQPEMSFVAAAALLVVGFFSLSVWLGQRDEPLYFLFFAMTVVVFVRMLHFHEGGSQSFVVDAWLEWIAQMSLLWLLVLAHCFLDRLRQQPVGWLTLSLVAFVLLFSASTTPVAVAVAPSIGGFTTGLYALCAPFTIVALVAALRDARQRDSRQARWVAMCLFLTAICSVYDLALLNNWVSPEGIYTQPYGVIGTLFVFGLIMFRRYMAALRDVQWANAHLALRLQQREAELAQSYQRLREVEQNQLLSDERQRLMQDMHDGLGSSLISAIRSVEHGGMHEGQVTQLLKDCMDDLKLAIDSMEPVEADLLLLLATLRFRLEPRMENSHVALVWEVQELPTLDWLDPSSALHILRIVQESVANILRHTQATEIRVGTSVEGAGVQVTIEDNGQGFDVAQTLARASGRGLHNQQRRAQTIQGTVAWQSGASGTRFTLWLPLKTTVTPGR